MPNRGGPATTSESTEPTPARGFGCQARRAAPGATMSAKARTLRAAVVGAGLMGRWHAHALARSGGRVAAVVDPNEPRARALAESYPGAAVYADLGAALGAAEVDVVHICTPLETHAPLARAAIERGRHLIVEKPLAGSAAESAELLARAAERGVLLLPVHQMLFQRGTQRLFAALPQLEPLRHLDFTACSAGAEGRDAAGRDRIAFEVLPHPLSLLARLLPDPPDELAWRLAHPAPGELRATAAAAGTTISITISMSGRPTVNTLRVIGAGGTAHLDLFHGFATLESAGVSRLRKVARPFSRAARTAAGAALNLGLRAVRREPAYPGLRELIRRGYAAIRGEAPPPIGAAEILAVIRTQEWLHGRG
jgi:predicted dehydrogenase